MATYGFDRQSAKQLADIARRLRGGVNDPSAPDFAPNLLESDIQFALTPAGGIDAMTDAGTGPSRVITPGKAECVLYYGEYDSASDDRLLKACKDGDDDHAEIVWNVSATEAEGDTIYPCWRTNDGTLFICPASSAATHTGFMAPVYSLPQTVSCTTNANVTFYSTSSGWKVPGTAGWTWSGGSDKWFVCGTAGWYRIAFQFRCTQQSTIMVLVPHTEFILYSSRSGSPSALWTADLPFVIKSSDVLQPHQIYAEAWYNAQANDKIYVDGKHYPAQSPGTDASIDDGWISFEKLG